MSSGTIATVGTFDGVHTGHLEVLRHLRMHGAEMDLEPLAITFRQHPLQLIAPERAPKMLLSPDEKYRMLRQQGVRVEMLDFDEGLRSMSAAEWMHRLASEYGARALVIGYDNTFGHDGRTLQPADYDRLGREAGLTVCHAPVVEGVSSSAVRRALLAGHVEEARDMLGRPYALEGRVVHGHAVGATIGFPTANIDIDPQRLVPATGVYAVTARIGGVKAKPLPAILNIGRRPTVDNGSEVSVECHIPRFAADIYGSTLHIGFGRRLRDEKKFNNLDALKAAIAADVAQIYRNA